MGEARALQRPWTRRRRRGLRALPLRFLAVGSLAAVVAAGLWAVDQARATRATVADVAQLAGGLPLESAPAPRSGAPGVLARSVDGIAFPDWTKLGWRAVGARRDEVGGREAVTLTYVRRGRRITYTIVGGVAGVERAAGRVIYRGRLALTFAAGSPGLTVLTFERTGRTVVMTARDPRLGRTMLRLANRRAGGRLAY